MHSQHATQCNTSANMHSHMEDGCFPEEKKNYEDGIQTENFIGTKIGNDIYYKGEKHY